MLSDLTVLAKFANATQLMKFHQIHQTAQLMQIS